MAAWGMIEHRVDSILIVSSIGALKGSSLIGAYKTCKAADLDSCGRIGKTRACQLYCSRLDLDRVRAGVVGSSDA
jgi:hypothetical protein